MREFCVISLSWFGDLESSVVALPGVKPGEYLAEARKLMSMFKI